MTKIMNANASNNTELIQELRERLEEVYTIGNVLMYNNGFRREELDWSEAERLEEEIEKLAFRQAE